MNFDFKLLRKSNLLLLIAILINLLIIINAGSRNTNIVLTKDTIVLNDRHKKHSNNIVIKDGHKDEHHCNCHYPMHHYEPHHHHDHGWDHWHKRSDLHVSPSNNWFDMQMASSNQFQQQHNKPAITNQQHTSSAFAYNNENTKFINGNGNEAINQLLKQRYLQPVKFNLAELQNLQLPVFVKN